MISNAKKEHLNEIVEIYNWAISHTTATFDTELKTVENQRKWFEEHGQDYPLIVYQEDEKVRGWASISQWSDRCAYSGTGEVSVYVDPDFHRNGIGGKLLSRLVELGSEKKFRTLLSRITFESEGSLILHRRLGFQDIGTMKSVGEKFGRIIDVQLMQYLYKDYQ